MTSPSVPQPGGRSPLGCRLHDWSATGRDAAYPAGSFRGLIVDLDDTLYPLEAFILSGSMAVARHVQSEFGIPAMDAFATLQAARRDGPPRQELQALCERYGLAASCVPKLLELFRLHRPLLHLPRESAGMLSHARATGWRIVVLTNGVPEIQRNKVAALGLRPLVDGVVYADDVIPGGKPAAAAFEAALQLLALPAHDCVCVGDDLHRDVAGAQALGMATVWLSQGNAAPTQHDDADVRISAIGELRDVLPRIWRVRKRDAA